MVFVFLLSPCLWAFKCEPSAGADGELFFAIGAIDSPTRPINATNKPLATGGTAILNVYTDSEYSAAAVTDVVSSNATKVDALMISGESVKLEAKEATPSPVSLIVEASGTEDTVEIEVRDPALYEVEAPPGHTTGTPIHVLVDRRLRLPGKIYDIGDNELIGEGLLHLNAVIEPDSNGTTPGSVLAGQEAFHVELTFSLEGDATVTTQQVAGNPMPSTLELNVVGDYFVDACEFVGLSDSLDVGRDRVFMLKASNMASGGPVYGLRGSEALSDWVTGDCTLEENRILEPLFEGTDRSYKLTANGPGTCTVSFELNDMCTLSQDVTVSP